MKKLIGISILLCIALFTVSALPQQPKGWEYKFQYQCDEKKANALAVEGWELHQMSMASYGSLGVATCVFKRPK